MATFIDVALGACVLLTLISGARSGFFRELFALAGLAAGLLLALRFATPILERAPAFLRHSVFAWTILFALLFVVAFVIFSLLGRALGAVWEAKNVPGISRLLGLLLGGVRGILLAIFLAGVLVMLAPEGSHALAQSRALLILGPGVRRAAEAILPAPARESLLRRWELLPYGKAGPGAAVPGGQSV